MKHRSVRKRDAVANHPPSSDPELAFSSPKVIIHDDEAHTHAANGSPVRGDHNRQQRQRPSSDGAAGSSIRFSASHEVRTFLGTVTLSDAIRAYICFLISVVFLYILDWKGALYFRPAEKAKYQIHTLFHDLSNVRSIEETTGTKIISLDEYEKKVREVEVVSPRTIARYEERMREKDIEFKSITAELQRFKSEKDSLIKKFEGLVANGASDLELFCDECTWKAKMKCGERKNYVVAHYQKRSWQAKMEILAASPNCRGKGPLNVTAIFDRPDFWPG